MTEMLYGRRPLPVVDEEPEGSLLGAAFRRENDVYNAWEMMGRVGAPRVDPDFNLFDHVQGLSDEEAALWERHTDQLLVAQSAGEFTTLLGRVRQEDRDRARIEEAGLPGVLAEMAAGVLSPTTLLPVIGATARGWQGVRQGFALGAVAGVAAEAPLQANQLTRTPLESGLNIAASTVLNGLLGSTASYLRHRDFQRLATTMQLEEAAIRSGEPVPVQAVVMRGADGAVVRSGEQAPLQAAPARFEFDVYHGTPAQDLRVSDLNPQRGMEVRGATFFSDAEDIAGQYSFAREFGEIVGGEQGQVMPARISFENPLEVDLGGRQFDAIEGTRLVEEAKRAGHDGLIVRNAVDSVDGTGEPSTTYAVFSRDQIRAPRAAADEVELVSAEPSTAGARETRAPDIPLQRVVDPDTGKETWEPVISVEEATQMDAALGVGEVLARTNPILRAAMQFDAPIRSIVTARNILRISGGGVNWRGAKHGVSMAAEGSVESRFQYYPALQGRAYKELYDAYSDYVHEGAKRTMPQRWAQAVRSEFNLTPRGKMNFQDFNHAVTKAMHTGDKHEIPQVQRVAQYTRREYFNAIKREAEDAAALWGNKTMFEEILSTDETSYMHRIMSPQLIAENRPAFIETISGHVAASAQAVWERRLAKAQKAYARDMDFVETLGLPAEEARRILDENSEMLARMKAQDNPTLARIAELRAEARDLLRDQLDEFERLREANPEQVVRYGEEGKESLRLADATPEQLRAVAKEMTAERREFLREEADRLEGGLPQETLEQVDTARQLRRQNAQIARSFGRLEERQAEALSWIEKNEELNLQAFQRVVQAVRRFDRDLARMPDEAAQAKELARLEELWQKAIKTTQRGEERLDRLEERLLLGTYTGKNALRESMQQTGRQQRRDRAFQRLSAAMLRDPDALRAELDARLEAAIAYTNNVNSKRSERNALLRQRVEELDPQRALDERTRITASWDRRWDELEEGLLKAGGTGVVRSGEIDFTEEAVRFATELSQRVMGQTQRVAQIDAMAGVRSPMRRRTLNIPYEQLEPFLEKDFEKILDRYTRTMGSDIELYRAFGDRSGSAALFDSLQDLDRIRKHLETRTVDDAGKAVTEAQRQKQLRAHDKAVAARTREFEGTLERVRSLRGLPEDGNSIGYRMGKAMLNLNVATMMGTVAVTSIPDLARPVFAHGFNNVLRDSWLPFLRSFASPEMRNINAKMKRELEFIGIGLETFTQQRSRNLFEMLEPTARSTGVERAVEYLAAKTPVVALFGPWTDAMKFIAGKATLARTLRIAEDVANGKASPDDIQYMAQLDLTEPMIRRIWDETARTGTRYKNVILPNMEDWTDHEAMRAFSAALSREDQRLVVTPGLEKALWTDKNIGLRLVAQFRSFTAAATSKMLIASLQSRDRQAVYAVQGVMLSMALGAVSYAVWALTAGPRQTEEMQRSIDEGNWELWLDQAFYRSGVMGWLGEGQSIGRHFGSLQALRDAVPGAGVLDPLLGFSDSPLSGRRATGAMGAIAGPTFGRAEQLIGMVQGLDEPTQATTRGFRQSVPWQNHFIFRRGFDATERGFNEYFNIPERRE